MEKERTRRKRERNEKKKRNSEEQNRDMEKATRTLGKEIKELPRERAREREREIEEGAKTNRWRTRACRTKTQRPGRRGESAPSAVGKYTDQISTREREAQEEIDREVQKEKALKEQSKNSLKAPPPKAP